MSKIFLVLCTTFFSSLVSAQSNPDLKPIKINGDKFGYSSNQSEKSTSLEILPQFDFAGQFDATTGLALVKINEHWAIIDSSGNFVKKIVIKDINLSGGKYAFCYGDWASYKQSGYNVVPDSDYQEDTEKCSDNLIGIINTISGKIIQEPRFDYISHYVYPDYYSIIKRDGKSGFYLPSTDYIFEPEFDEVIGFRGNIGAVKRNNNYQIITKKDGKVQTDPSLYDYIDPHFLICDSENTALVIIKKGNLFGYVNTKGIVAEPMYDDLDKNCSNLMWFKRNGKIGFMNKKGEEVIAPIYDETKKISGSENPAVKIKGRWGFIDKNGDLIVEPKYVSLDFPKYEDVGLAKCVNGKYGYISKTGHGYYGPQKTECSFDKAEIEAYYTNDYSRYYKVTINNQGWIYDLGENSFISLEEMNSIMARDKEYFESSRDYD